MGNDLAKVPAANTPVAVQPERMNADPFWGSVSKHKFAEFNVCTTSLDENNNEVVFSFPDYAGEQVNFIIDTRRINTQWKQYLDESNSRLLFVRLDDVKEIANGFYIKKIIAFV